jgi:hypothetical protein
VGIIIQALSVQVRPPAFAALFRDFKMKLLIVMLSICFTVPIFGAVFSSTFDDILDRQVVQRNERNQASISVSASVLSEVDTIEFKATPLLGDHARDTGWRTLNGDGLSFQSDIVLHGGWYQLDMRAIDNGSVIDTAVINHFGVGEVFIMTGQSNAANTGETTLLPEDDRVNAFVLDSYTDWSWPNVISWQHASDPQPIGTHDLYSPRTCWGSSWPPLGDALVDYYDVPVGWTNVAWSGSSVAYFTDFEGFRYQRLRDAIQYMGLNGVRCIIWHQGESDYNTSDEDYASDLLSVVNQTRIDGGYDLTWGIALVKARGGQLLAIESDPLLFEGADTDTLLDSIYRQYPSIHFTEEGQYAHAQLWFEKIVHVIDDLMLIPGDINNDGFVGIGDLGLLGSQWGYAGIADWTADGVVDVSDLAVLSANWSVSSDGSLQSIPLPCSFVIFVFYAIMIPRRAYVFGL